MYVYFCCSFLLVVYFFYCLLGWGQNGQMYRLILFLFFLLLLLFYQNRTSFKYVYIFLFLFLSVCLCPLASDSSSRLFSFFLFVCCNLLELKWLFSTIVKQQQQQQLQKSSHANRLLSLLFCWCCFFFTLLPPVRVSHQFEPTSERVRGGQRPVVAAHSLDDDGWARYIHLYTFHTDLTEHPVVRR